MNENVKFDIKIKAKSEEMKLNTYSSSLIKNGYEFGNISLFKINDTIIEGKYEFFENEKNGEYFYENCKKNGKYIMFNNKHGFGCKVEGVLKNGKKEGIITKEHLDGVLTIQKFFKNDIQEGKHVVFYNNGQVWMKCNYKNNQRNGRYREWYTNGNLEKQCYYKNDCIQGKCEDFDENGNCVCTYYVGGRVESNVIFYYFFLFIKYLFELFD
jgi:antitoxin component YwqK of YwqJK toxin-antitoxin module